MPLYPIFELILHWKKEEIIKFEELRQTVSFCLNLVDKSNQIYLIAIDKPYKRVSLLQVKKIYE